MIFIALKSIVTIYIAIVKLDKAISNIEFLDKKQCSRTYIFLKVPEVFINYMKLFKNRG